MVHPLSLFLSVSFSVNSCLWRQRKTCSCIDTSLQKRDKSETQYADKNALTISSSILLYVTGTTPHILSILNNYFMCGCVAPFPLSLEYSYLLTLSTFPPLHIPLLAQTRASFSFFSSHSVFTLSLVHSTFSFLI